MDLKAIQYVQEIVRCRSMTKAAENLYLSQSALSQYMKRLESTLGVPLFRKEGSRLQLTQKGEIFLREGTSILNAYENMIKHIEQTGTMEDSSVKLGVSGFYGQFFLPTLLPMLKEKCPNINLHLVQENSTVLQQLVKEHALDLCISPLPKETDGLIFEHLCMEEIMIAVQSDCAALSEAVPGDDFPSINLRALRDYPFLMMQRGQIFSENAYRLCASAGFEPHVSYELMSWSSIYTLMLARVDGVAFLPREITQHKLLKNDGVTFCHIIAPAATTRPVMICLDASREPSPAELDVIRLIKEVTRQDGFAF